MKAASMTGLSPKAIQDLAHSAIGMGRVVEAHADADDIVRKVVVELPEWVKNPEVRERVSTLWQERGFIASVNKEGLLIVDGIRGGTA